MPEKKPHAVIIGNGITGITAALTARELLPSAEITVISDEYEYPYARTSLMYIYMNDVNLKDTELFERNFYKKNRITLLKNTVIKIEAKQQKIIFFDGNSILYDVLLLATGSRPNVPPWPRNDMQGVTGMYHLNDLQKIEDFSKKGIQNAVITGGGLIGIELAEMLHSRNIPVTFLIREQSYFKSVLAQEESEIISREITAHGINLRPGEEIREVKGKNNHVTGVITAKGNEYQCNFLGVTTGVKPVTELAITSGIQAKRGILTNEFLETNIPGIFAAGDCAEVNNGSENFVQQLWYSGKRQAIVAAHNMVTRLCDTFSLKPVMRKPDTQPGFSIPELKTGVMTAYERGIYFNSAKFFTVNYQVYGNVPASSNENNSIIYAGKTQNKLIRLTYMKEKNNVLFSGVNVLNCPLRHEICENWLRKQYTLKQVVNELDDADFNPEFSGSFLKDFKLVCESKLAEMNL